MAYNITGNYKQVIYSGDSRHKIKILFNNVELQDADRYCERAIIKSRIIPNGAKRFSLNNFISKEVEIILHDINTNIIQDKVSISIGTFVGNSYEYVPIGIFNIQGTPTTDKNKITIKLRDNSVKFDFNYNAKPLIDEKGGSATKLQILQDICSKANVTCNITSFLGSTDSIGIYDNTITARQYIADIAEQAGKIATINRNGELIFVNLNSLTTWNIPLSIVEKYEIGKAYRIGKVVYEDAIRKYETESTNYDTLYLDASNPYISSQEQVNSILQQVNNFTIDSVKTGKILGNPAIDSYDLINVYDDKVEGNPSIFKTLATNELVYNGVLINTFDTQIGEEERKENVSIVGEATFKKWATTNINNINGEIDIQAGKIDNVEKEINPTQDATGTSFYLEDSTNAELVNFEMEGKTTQETSTEGSNICPPPTDSKWVFGGGAYVDNNGNIQFPNANSAVSITLDWNKRASQMWLGINIVTGGNLFLSTQYLDDNMAQLGGNGSAVSDKGANYRHTANFGSTSPYNEYIQNAKYIKLTISRNTTYAPNVFSINQISWSATDSVSTYTPFTPNMPSPDYPSELVSVGYENYLDTTITSQTVNGINFTINQDKSIRVNGTATATAYLTYPTFLLKKDTYRFDAGVYVNTLTRLQLVEDITGRPIIASSQNARSQVFTISEDKNVFLQFRINNGETIDITFYPLLTKGTQAHSFIPYGKYGIEVKTTGKNLYNEINKTNNVGLSWSTGTTYAETKSIVSDYIDLKDINNIASNYSFAIMWYDNAKTYLGNSVDVRTTTGTNYRSIQKPNNLNIAYCRLAFRTSYNNNVDMTTIADIMVCETYEDALSDYEEYKSKTYLYTLNQPLRSIGNTKDLLYIKNGMLYVERKIGSATFKGTETWNLYSSNTVRTIFYTPISQQMESYTLTSDIPKLMSSHFISASQNATWKNGDISRRTQDQNSLYLIVANGYTIDTFKTWLSTHNTEVQYILASSNTEGLGKIEVPSTYKTITHIDTIDINEPNMNITYVRDTQLTNYVEEHISQIIVNEEGISSRVQTIEDSDYDEKINAIETQQTSTDFRINAISKNVTFTEFDDDGNPTNSNINSVTTTTGFTFDENGLNIKKSDTDYNTLIDNTGTYYKDGETIISMTNKDGFLAKDFRLQGQHYYSYNATNPSEPLASENYDFVDERIEVEVDGQTQYAYATFYNGEV